jgi:hypothetical protein
MAENQAADAGCDRPPLRPGEIGPNYARNRALKKRRRQAQAAREQAVSYTIYLSKIESGTNKKKKGGY